MDVAFLEINGKRVGRIANTVGGQNAVRYYVYVGRILVLFGINVEVLNVRKYLK